MSQVRIVIDPGAPEDLRRMIQDRVDMFNVAVTGLSEYYPLAIFLRDERDEVLGGLLGNIWGGWMHVASLWIAEPIRGRGHGRALLEAAERYAIEKGCRNVFLDSFSFQAPKMYQKLGYEAFGTLEDHPPGHVHVFLRKRLLG